MARSRRYTRLPLRWTRCRRYIWRAPTFNSASDPATGRGQTRRRYLPVGGGASEGVGEHAVDFVSNCLTDPQRDEGSFPLTSEAMTKKHRIYTTSVASVYPHYVAKAEKKGRTKAEVDEIIRWLTGLSQEELDAELAQGTDFETFFANAPRPNPARALITGVVCGVRVETIEEPTMREIRYLDKLVDELARGKSMEKILRR